MVEKYQSRDIYELMEGGTLDRNQIHHLYNALDSAVTLRVWKKLKPLVDASPHATVSYNFVRAMQGPALDMMNTGMAINAKVRQDETERYLAIRNSAQALLDRLADAVWGPEEYIEVSKVREVFQPTGKRGNLLQPRTRVVRTETRATRPRGLNANSDKQVLAFFNIALKFPVEYEIRKTPQGSIRTPTANNKALRKWAAARSKGPGIDPRDRSVPAVNFGAPFVSLILTVRDADKMLAVLRTPLDVDGRMRCSYNVVGTENGRWSSSKNAFGRGTNLQNITPSMRRMFCADDGHVLVSTDLEQAESRLVAGLVWQTTGDDTYWNACLSGDLHTTVARMTWPEAGWSEDPKENRKLADRPSGHPKYTMREASKRFGHGSNYDGSDYGIAQEVGVSSDLVRDFQMRYFTPFKAIRQWHAIVKQQVTDHQYLDTPLGRRRWFFGRPNEAKTHREAIAYGPQSTVGELLNLIMYKVWARSKLPFTHPQHLLITLLLQNHDAFAFQTLMHPQRHSRPLEWIIRQVDQEFNTTPITFRRGAEARDLVIPGEFVTGFNWAYADTSPNQAAWMFKDGNPDGLRKWTGKDDRTRVTPARSTSADWLRRGPS